MKEYRGRQRPRWEVQEEAITEREAEDDNHQGLTGRQHEDFQRVLELHAEVFHEPKGLPPNKEMVHRIPLKERVDPVNVWPHRYPHVMKGEIESQVKEMIRTGIIRPSTSPYSSPIILVKKNDGSWYFCVDYRALNRATIPNKFPIPIEEFMDELRGARYFS